MRIMISLIALFLSVILLQLSSSRIGPLDALSGLRLNFLKFQIGFLGLIIFGFLRFEARPTKTVRAPCVSIPRTSFTIGRLLRRSRK